MAKIVDITLDKERKIHFTLNSFRILEKDYGIKFDDLKEFDFETIQAMLYVGLRTQDKSLTFEQVGDFVDLDNFEEVTKKVVEAFQSNSPKK